QLHNFARLLTGIARSWVKVPDSQLERLRQLRKRVDPGKGGMTERNKARLRQFANPVNVRRLIGLPDEIVRLATRNQRPSYNGAVPGRSAVAIAIDLAAPLRAANLARLAIDRHILRTGTGPWATVHLVVPAGEVKNDVALEFVLPPGVVRLIDLYCER